MTDLSQNKRDNYKGLEQAEAYKNICGVNAKGRKPSEVVDFYNKWADNNEYEKNLPDDFYTSPTVTAHSAAEGLTNDVILSAKVLDVAAGTGLCAEKLKKFGFQHIDALDPSDGMLEQARVKGLYERYVCNFITEKPLNIEKATYDVLTCSGGFAEGHVPCGALHEMIRVVKPGGHIVIVTRFEHLQCIDEYRGRLEPLMDKLEAEGKWTKVERKIFKGFLPDKEGILWKYKVC